MRFTSARLLSLALVAAVLAAVFYCAGLNTSPIYLTKDEASYAIQSHAIATTGRDTNGRLMPLFFQEPGFSIGRDPIYIYASALILKARPMEARSLRLPTTIAAVLTIGLIVFVASELFGVAALGAVAAMLLAVTPVFFIRSRAALSVILPVPFQLAWLLCLLYYARDGRLRHLVIGTAALGLGLYSYLSMLLFAPIHLLFSLAEIARHRRWRHAAVAVGLFGGLLIPLVLWQFSHPGHVTELASSYRVYPAGLTPLQGIKDVLSWSSLTLRSDIYWNAFNPSRLFFAGESSLVDSTRAAGLFPLVFLVLLPIGFYDFLTRPLTVPRLAILSVFVIGPVPGALVGEETIGRYLFVAPMAALVATAALARLWQTGRVVLRVAAIGMLLSSVWLFAGFYQDYMGDWRIRSARYFGGNLQGAMTTVLTASPAPDLVYLSEGIPYVNVYWDYYRRALGRPDLAGRERGLRLADADWREGTGRAMAIVPGDQDATMVETLRSAGWVVTSEIREPDGGAPTFYVLTRG